jgi:RNA recognition motif-containing protein
MAEDSSRKLFVAGLPDTMSEDVLRQLFEATGGVVADVTLPKDRTTGRPRGFGFVTMATTEEANAARESLHGSFQGGRSISVRPFESDPPKREIGAGPGSSGPRGDRGPMSGGGPASDPPDRKLYVGNLPYDATVEEVEAVINATGAGPVVRTILPSDPDGRKRGFGFVTMASADAAKNAVDLLKGAEVRGRRLVINPAHQKGERPPPREGGGYVGGGGGGFGGGPPRDFGGGPPRDFGAGPPRDFGGPPRGAPPGGGGGGFGGGPPPQRKTFDDRKRKTDGDGGGRGRRQKDDWDPGKVDWEDD